MNDGQAAAFSFKRTRVDGLGCACAQKQLASLNSWKSLSVIAPAAESQSPLFGLVGASAAGEMVPMSSQHSFRRSRSLLAVLMLAMMSDTLALGPSTSRASRADVRRASEISDNDAYEAFRWVGAVALERDNYTLAISKVDGTYCARSLVFLVAHVGSDWRDRMELLEAEVVEVIRNGTSESCGFDLQDDHADENEDEDHGHDHGHTHDHGHRRNDPGQHLNDEDDISRVGCGHSAAQGSRVLIADPLTLFVAATDESMATTLVALSVEEPGTFLVFSSQSPRDFQNRALWLQKASGEAVEVEELFGAMECKSRLSDGEVWVLSLFGTLVGAAMSLVGVVFFFPVIQASKELIILYLHSLAAGVLLALTVVHLIPEAISLVDRPWKASACVMGGFSAAMLLEHCLRIKGEKHAELDPWLTGEKPPAVRLEDDKELDEVLPGTRKGQNAQAGPADSELPKNTTSALLDVPREDAPREGGGGGPVLLPQGSERAMVLNILVGDMFHNFFDGVLVALAFRMCGAGMGWTVTASAVVHELPQEISDFVLLVEAGLSMRQALYLNFLSSLSAFLGVFVVLPIGELTAELERAMGMVLGVGAGVMLYIAIDLIPGILSVKRFNEARLCWLAFASGAVLIGLTLLMHVHCDCEDSLLNGDVNDPHAGHNH